MTHFQNLLRVTALAIVVAVTAGTGLAYGASVSGINNTTGPWSSNTSTFATDRLWNVDVLNNQDLLNSFNVDVNSGANAADCNTSVLGANLNGNINIAIATAPTSPLYNGFGILYGLGGFMPIDNVGILNTASGNALTGPNSLNENIINANQAANINLSNNSIITNDVNITANTGNNIANNNTSVFDGVSSGGISVSAVLNNGAMPYPGVVAPAVVGTGLNNVIGQFGNNLTGPNSINSNVLNANSQFNALIDNQSVVTNDLNISANTGNNVVSNNTTVAGVGTGNVNVSIAAAN